MDNLEIEETDAVVTDSPSSEETQDSKPETVEEEEKELTDEELKEEISRLDEEIQKEEDAKEKRHKEQSKGWLQKNLKERDKAKLIEEANRKAEEKLKSFESSLIEEAYSKTIDDNFGLPYFENLNKTNPDLANKLAKDKWNKTAKELILDSKRTLAENGDEELQKYVSEEDIRASEREKVYHDLAIEQAEQMFNELNEQEKSEAKEFFDDIVDGKKLTPAKAKKYAEMAIFQATRNRVPEKSVVDKDRVVAEKASTGISPKSGSKEAIVGDKQAIIQQLVNSGVPRYLAEAMYS